MAMPRLGSMLAAVGRSVWVLLAAVVLLAALAYGALVWLDQPSGQRFLLSQLHRFKPVSGLTIGAERIEGSIYGKLRIFGLRLSDPKGVFLTAPVIDLDWRPRDLLGNTLTVRSAEADTVRLARLPQFNPTPDEKLLPDFDIFVGRLRIGRLELAAPVAGTPRDVRVDGRADIRAGRALVRLDAAALPMPGAPGGDAIVLALDAEPDRDRFDIEATVDAPAGGIVAGMAGLTQPAELRLSGDGRWSDWRGTARARLGGDPLADLAVTAQQGRFRIAGGVMPAPLLDGAAARLLGPRLELTADLTLGERRLDAALRAASPALLAEVRGRLDLAEERFDGVRLSAQLLRPAAISPQLRARDLRLAAKVAGRFAAPLVDWTLTAPAAAWGETMVTGLRAGGIADLSRDPLTVPVAIAADAVTGLGAEVDPLLAGLRIDGPLVLRGGTIGTEALQIRTNRLTARGSGRYDTARGVLTAALNGSVPGYALPNVGVADVSANVTLATTSAGLRASGTARAAARRIDSDGVRGLLGGLPVVDAAFDLAPDSSVVLRSLRLAAPELTLAGTGSYSARGTVQLNIAGTSRSYGPMRLAVAGPAAKPQIDLALARPGLGIGLAAVEARLTPDPAGWRFSATGASDYGPLAARGVARTENRPVTIELAEATAAGITANGTLHQTPAGPFAGNLGLSGTGFRATAALSAQGPIQRIDVAAHADDARFRLATPVTLARGEASAVVLFGDGGPTIAGSGRFAGLVRGPLEIASGEAAIDYRGHTGNGRIRVEGRNDATPFALEASGNFDQQDAVIAAAGTYDGRRIALERPAVLSRQAGGWRLAPTVLLLPQGRIELSGAAGKEQRLQARLDQVGLGLLSLASPSLDIDGRLSGTVDLLLPADGALPVGTAELRVNGLSRASIGTAGAPINIGINAAMNAQGASARAVIARAGRVEGRAQASLTNIPGTRDDPMLERLLAAPLFAQLRWNGPARALWQLTGNQTIDVRGRVAIAADVGGRLGEPRLSGTVTSDRARIESTTIGLVIEQIQLESRFTESRLEIIRFTGNAGKDGTIKATGAIDLALQRGIAMDIGIDLANARLLGRDDLSVTLTGPVRIQNDPLDGPRITGRLEVNRANYVVGGPAVADVPTLPVREIGGDARQRAAAQRVAAASRPTVWKLDVKVAADNRVFVTGMGLDSEWSGDLSITGNVNQPRIVGPVRLVRGDYDFAGKRFQLTRGEIRFTGGLPPDPIINVNAENIGSNLTATLSVTGTALKPQIAFGSIPALPEDEVLSRVLFGESVTNLSAPEAIQLAAALASLRGGSGGFNPIGTVQKTLGIDRLRILPADSVRGSGTAVAAGEYIGDRLYVEVATDAQGFTATRVELSLTRSLSILSEIATLGGTSVAVRWKKDY